jgi:preprotein translocase subunit YajC
MPRYVVFAQEKDAKEAPKAEVTQAKEEVPTKDPATKQQSPSFELPLILGGIFFVFYFVVLRPQKRRADRERQDQLNMLEKNDKVLTIGGIYGSIISVSDKEDEVVVKVDDNTRLKMTKASIGRNITREEKLKAEKEAKTQDKPK